MTSQLLVGRWICNSSTEAGSTYELQTETGLILGDQLEFELDEFVQCHSEDGNELYSFCISRKGNWDSIEQTLTLKEISIDVNRISSPNHFVDPAAMKQSLMRDLRLETREYLIVTCDQGQLELESKNSEFPNLRLSRIE